MGLKTRYEIDLTVAELMELGIDVEGRYGASCNPAKVGSISTRPGRPGRRRAHRPPDAVPDKALSLGERVPAGTCHLGFLNEAHVTAGRREGVPEVEVSFRTRRVG